MVSNEEIKENLKYLKLLSKQYPSISKASTEIINLEAMLNLPKGTEHFLSDIHGEYESFVHVLKNGSGVIKRKIEELFQNTIRDSEKKTLATLVYYPERKLEFIKEKEENVQDFYKINIYRLIELCKYCSSKYTRAKVRKLLPEDYRYIIEELLHEHRKSEHKEEYYLSLVEMIINLGNAEDFIIAICTAIQKLVVDRLHIVGDIYDRGPRPDIIVDKLMEHHSVDVQWGNHDILWMGAAAGEKTCIANALRVSARYGNLDILEDIYGINLLPVATFASEEYKNDPCTQFMPKISDGEYTIKEKKLMAKIHKAVSIIQFKLEAEVIKRRPEFEMDSRLVLNKINYDENTITIKGKKYNLLDNLFPTIDPKNPYRLTYQEQAIIDKLVDSFKTSEKLQKHIAFLFSKGSIYLKSTSNLLLHACIPLDENGDFLSMELKGKKYSGRKLMDKFEKLAREGYFEKEGEDKQYGLDALWYLWTGKCSALFGKYEMTTFERYFIAEQETHKEKKNSYFTLRENEKILKKLFDEFELDFNDSRIISGHVPVKMKKGESPVKANGRVLVIDGGFSKAYQSKTGFAGYTLIYNSRTLQLVSHEPFTSAEDAVVNETDILSTTVLVEHKSSRKKIKDTEEGQGYLEKIDDLNMLLSAYRKGLLKEA